MQLNGIVYSTCLFPEGTQDLPWIRFQANLLGGPILTHTTKLEHNLT